MKIKVEQSSVDEPEIIIRCQSMTDDILKLISLLNSQTQTLCVWEEKKQLLNLAPYDIFYIESVDDKSFVYCQTSVYQTALTLAELESKYEQAGLCRINKSTIINLYHITSLKSFRAGKIEATIKNGEKLMVSRHYAPLLRDRLER